MIGLSAEVQLLLAAAFFYLYDASVLLYANEGLLCPTGGGRWRLIYRPDSIALRGRLMYIPNPVLPHRPVFRLLWRAESVSFEDAMDWRTCRTRYLRLVPFVYAGAVSIFVVLPVCLAWRRSDMQVLAVAALIYVNAMMAGYAVIRFRVHFGVERRKAWATAIECVLCPPFTVNLIRRLSLAQRTATSIPAAGANLLDAEAWERLNHKLVAVQDEEIEDAVSDASRDALIQARATLLAARRPHDNH